MALIFSNKGFTVSKTVSDCKKWKMWNICVFKLLIWHQKWAVFVRHGNSLPVHRLSPGKKIVVLFWTKYVVSCPIKPRILKLTFRNGQCNFNIVFTFSSCEEKGNFRVLTANRTAGSAAQCKKWGWIERFSFECRNVIGFAISTLRDWLKKFAPLFHPIRSKTKTIRDSLAHVFPRFASGSCNYFEFWLVHWIVCVFSDWLA